MAVHHANAGGPAGAAARLGYRAHHANPSPRLPAVPPIAPHDPLEDDLLRAIAARGGVRTYPTHAVLISEDDSADSLYIVLAGRIKVYGSAADGREVVYVTLGPGEYVGELTLDGGPRSASVMTLEPTRCVVVPGAQVRDFLATHPDFAHHLIIKLIAMIRRSTRSVKQLALDDVHARVVRLLADLAGSGPYPRALSEQLTQQDIAERVGSSREMVNRVLQRLSKGGWVARRAGHIELLRALPVD